MSGHERERLSAYLDGELAPGERAEVEAHLAACPECTAFLAEMAAADEAAAALPVEAPAGYFDTFPRRVRARLRPRRAAVPPARRVPAWTWAAAAALLLAVITPLTLRQSRPAAQEARRPSEPLVAVLPPTKDEPKRSAPLRVPEPRPTPAPRLVPQATPAPTTAPPAGVQGPAVGPPVAKAVRPKARDEAAEGAEGAFAPEPGALVPPAEPALGQEAPADTGPGRAVGDVSGDASSREKRAGTPRPAPTAEAASPMMSSASAGREATPTSLKAQEDAFRRLEAVRPRTAAGWRRVREQWKAVADAETDPGRADEARVRAIIAAREAWKAEGDGGDEAVFRIEAATYLRREDARQKPRVEGLLAEAAPRPAP